MRKFMSLVFGDRSMVEYEVEFLRVSINTWALVAFDYDKCVQFDKGLR